MAHLQTPFANCLVSEVKMKMAQKKMSTADLVRVSGVDHAAISRMLARDKRNFTFETGIKLVRSLNLDINYLTKEKGNL